MDASAATPRLGVSTSTNAGGAAASGPSVDGLASPVLPAAADPKNPQPRRRSTLAEDTDAWHAAQRKPESAAGESLAERRDEEDDDDDGLYAGAGGEGAALLADDEETGLADAERRKRRLRKEEGTQLDQRVVAGDGAPAQGLPRGSTDGKEEPSVARRSAMNVGLIGLWYLFSLSISIYNKWMFGEDHLDFPFPLFTTSTHMLVQFILSSLVLYLFPRFRPNLAAAAASGEPAGGLFSVVTRWFYLTRLGPCGAATGLDIGLGNMSLKFITLTFYTMCKSSALAFVLLFAFVFRLETPSMRLVLIIAAMTGGVVMMVSGEVNFNALGFVLIMLSSFFSGFRWALTQILLLRHPATSNPFASIFFLTPIMFVCLLALAIPVEGFGPLFAGLADLVATQGPALGPLLLLFPGVLAFCMTSAEYALLQRTSVVTLSICGIFKEVVTITAAEITYHDPLTPINLSGLAVTVASIAAYNYIKVQKMRADAAEQNADPARDRDERRGMLAPEAIEMEEVGPDPGHRRVPGSRRES